MKQIYLIRHPKPTYKSFYNKLDIDHNNPEKLITFEKNYDHYQVTWEFFQKYPGKVVIAEDLQEDPDQIVKECYEYCGLNFSEEFLSFDNKDSDSVGNEWKCIDKSYYQEALSSTCIKKEKVDIEKIEVNDFTKKRAEAQLPYYQKFVEASKL
eukprot:CAMPEP_0170536016 /NCGR_PEP_ID=MMETSP0209-20121228/101918_1 /TAXON_ID=665100 ORGANISM="Litonotus pictus, Strain P1" /NCGR_SAMPLE_ID=MMETSP0209 /ASSEMBLY_ACC=CAM_ASM_000301 /LENGTH=152 /DNA_ID=CAMNT_0010837341 /DNA_START=414 /DNA_END=869 /DNA_ORIENTATION=+